MNLFTRKTSSLDIRMPSERLGLRAWLEQKIDNCEFPGVEWLDRSRGTFVIPWKHASRHGWEQNQDAALFKAWAIYTGRYVEGNVNLFISYI